MLEYKGERDSHRSQGVHGPGLKENINRQTQYDVAKSAIRTVPGDRWRRRGKAEFGKASQKIP